MIQHDTSTRLSRDEEFAKTAREFVEASLELAKARKQAEESKAEADRLKVMRIAIERRLSEFVGRNLSSRTAVVEGGVVLVEFGENEQHRIRQFDKSGQPVLL